ncbi:hypothetical protein SS50377_25661 [Spironucleus salmonicida]|uniref:Tetratricopeptide repeat-containing protein n=1 Tax=Spironucleus salmonicida TaxID=348837 RepID=V6LXZ9_9EUKA|nr:hypothetical protein SS50377_25661 [Spironucleus salmonicida]|eukprot:EST49440.1 Hypothetical protein SS50377_10187 [Spironucleus salmonicida]
MDTKSFLRNGMVLMRECEYDEACECFIPACIQICSLIPCLIQIPELQIYIESTASEIQHIQAAFNCLSILAFAQYKAGHYSTASIVSTQLIRLLSRHGVLSHHALFNNIIYARSNAPMSAVSHCRRLQMDSSTRARASYELGMCYLDSDEDLAMEQFQLSNSLGYQMAEHAICELLHKKNLLDAKRARVNAKHCPGKRLFVKVLLHLNLQEPASKECRHMLTCDNNQCARFQNILNFEFDSSIQRKVTSTELSESQLGILASRYNSKLIELIDVNTFKNKRIDERVATDIVTKILKQ